MKGPPPRGQRVTPAGLFDMAMRAEAAGQAAQAQTFFQMLAQNGQIPLAAAMLAQELEASGRYDKAEAALRAGLRQAPGDLDLTNRLGRHRLREGDFAEGWRLLETRSIEISGDIRGRPQLSYPEWTGGPVTSLLVFAEQGLGDQIQFARYVPVLRARGIAVTFACATPLIPLFGSLGAQLIAAVPGAALPRCDAWTMLLSLPRLLGTTLETIPPPFPLAATPGGRGFGLVTNGNPRHANDHNRSLPQEIASELLGLPGAVSLHPEDTGVRDFAATAAIVDRLAEVVTVDTSVAHLAGTMGKPCRVLLPYVPDWRWLRGRTDSPWYPSVTLYRQPGPGDWRSVVTALRRDLAAS